ncbi:MAG: hemerythrin family protein [Deltaproteobacteria bacterium]|nr:hemerythrin family protein [Deltaproteobacteria bacterium]
MSALIVWKAEYDSGIEFVDAQHRGIVEVANTLFRALESGSNPELARVLALLVEYSESHFAAEEAMLAATPGYPDLAKHRLAHSAFITRVRSQCVSPKPEEVMRFIREWLVHHFLGIDRQYLSYVRPTRAAPSP